MYINNALSEGNRSLPQGAYNLNSKCIYTQMLIKSNEPLGYPIVLLFFRDVKSILSDPKSYLFYVWIIILKKTKTECRYSVNVTIFSRGHQKKRLHLPELSMLCCQASMYSLIMSTVQNVCYCCLPRIYILSAWVFRVNHTEMNRFCSLWPQILKTMYKVQIRKS